MRGPVRVRAPQNVLEQPSVDVVISVPAPVRQLVPEIVALIAQEHVLPLVPEVALVVPVDAQPAVTQAVLVVLVDVLRLAREAVPGVPQLVKLLVM